MPFESLIPALATVVVAVIVGTFSVLTTRDDRKKALDEADLLAKIQGKMGTKTQAEEDLREVIARRAKRWKANAQLDWFAAYARGALGLFALLLLMNVAANLLRGGNPTSGILFLLGEYDWVPTVLIVVWAIVYIVQYIRFGRK